MVFDEWIIKLVTKICYSSIVLDEYVSFGVYPVHIFTIYPAKYRPNLSPLPGPNLPFPI